MRKAALLACVLSAFVLGAVTVSVAGSPGVTEPTRIHVIEHPTTDWVIDVGREGDSTGDLLTFHNALYNATDTKKVGHDQGECIRISAHQGTWECRWIAWLEGGAITVEGPFFDTRDSVMAITGGTGMYRNARGTMALSADPNGTFHFVYNVIP